MNIKLVALDIDGTLLTSDGQVTPRSFPGYPKMPKLKGFMLS